MKENYSPYKLIEGYLIASIKSKESLWSQAKDLIEISNKVCDCFNYGGKLLIFGNGGSAADAQHIAGEFVGRFKKERKGLPAIALTTDTSVMTALANDYDYSIVFSRQIESLANKEDVLLGISTSGNSKNVIEALKKGKEIGTFNISLTGNDGGLVKNLSDLNINIPYKDTPRIQEAHQLAYHIICELVERRLYK